MSRRRLYHEQGSSGGGGGVSEFDLATVYPSSGLAFPSAEGPGRNASVGPNPVIFFLTSRSDVVSVNDLASYGGATLKSGSIRGAMALAGPRIIIPLVGGNILLNGGINVQESQMYYAGQFCPQGKGVALKMRNTGTPTYRNVLNFYTGTDYIVRFLKIYGGTGDWTIKNVTANTIGFSRRRPIELGATRVMLDHLSLAFGSDQIYSAGGGQDVTVQHIHATPMIAYGLHSEDGGVTTQRHNRGPLIGYEADRFQVHHNLFAKLLDGRGPLFTGYDGKVYSAINNYSSDVDFAQSSYPASGSDHHNTVDFVRNYAEDCSNGYVILLDPYPNGGSLSIYLEGNRDDAYRTSDSMSQTTGVRQRNAAGIAFRSSPQSTFAAIRQTSALVARDDIMAWGGAALVRNPLTGALIDIRDTLQNNVLTWVPRKTVPMLHADPSQSPHWQTYDPTLPNVSMSVSDFWADWFEPWRNAHFPGLGPIAAADERTVIERFLDACVPDFPALD